MGCGRSGADGEEVAGAAEPALAALERRHLERDVPLAVSQQGAHLGDAGAHGLSGLVAEAGGRHHRLCAAGGHVLEVPAVIEALEIRISLEGPLHLQHDLCRVGVVRAAGLPVDDVQDAVVGVGEIGRREDLHAVVLEAGEAGDRDPAGVAALAQALPVGNRM